MNSRHLVSALFVTVLSVGIASISIAGDPFGPFADETFSTAASSGGCFPPSIAVDLYGEAAGGNGVLDPDVGEDSEDCEEICDRFRKTCRDIAKQSRSCGSKGGSQWASLVRTACSTIEDKEERDDCRDTTDDEQDLVDDCRKADREHAEDCCDEFEDVCLADCNDEEFDVPACFTGPGGIGDGSCFFNLLNTPF